MNRSIYTDDHEQFRRVVRAFITKEIAPVYDSWEGIGPPRELWRRAGELGILGLQVPEEFGGGGMQSFKFNAIFSEEVSYACVPMGGFRAHTDMALPYLLKHATPAQQARWLPGIASGEIVLSIAMTEPAAGSDLAGITTTAVREGDEYVVNGSKTFISNGLSTDLVLLVVKTDANSRHDGISLLAVEADRPGFERGRSLKKLGLHAQETSELFFSDVRVPVDNRIGDEGAGFTYLTQALPQERLSIAIAAQASAVGALERTVTFARDRKMFGTTLGSLQNTRFELAGCATDVHAGQVLIDDAIERHDRGELAVREAAMTKLFCTEMLGRVVDRCLQLHGGYGYMDEYPISRYYADARATRLYGGTSEIMKTIIAKSMDLS